VQSFTTKHTGKTWSSELSGGETGFVAAVAILGRVISVFGVIKKLLGL